MRGCGRNSVSAGSLFLVGGCWFAHSMYGRGVRMIGGVFPLEVRRASERSTLVGQDLHV